MVTPRSRQGRCESCALVTNQLHACYAGAVSGRSLAAFALLGLVVFGLVYALSFVPHREPVAHHVAAPTDAGPAHDASGFSRGVPSVVIVVKKRRRTSPFLMRTSSSGVSRRGGGRLASSPARAHPPPGRRHPAS